MYKHFFILILLFSILCCPAYSAKKTETNIHEVQSASVQQDTTYSCIEKASDKFMQKDTQGAITILSQGIQAEPNNPLLYLNRGFIKHVLLDFSGAMEDYNSAIKVAPNYSYAYNNRGVLKVSLNDVKGAMEDYATALNLNPKYSDVYYNRGNLKYMLNDNEGALADYDLAIKYNPKDSEAYNNRGVVKKRMDFNVGALSDYSQAIALNPKDSIAFANRGRLKKLYFDNEGAAIDLNKAIELAENQVFIKNVKPLLSNQHYIAAIPVAKSLEGTDFYNPKTELSLSPSENNNLPQKIDNDENNQKIANANKGIKPIKSATDVSSPKQTNIKSSETAAINKSNGTVLNAGVGKIVPPTIPDIRTSQVTKSATTNIKLAESYYIRGLQKCVLHDMQGAVADLDKAIANNANYADAYYYRGIIKKELGDKEGFRKDYASAIQMNPALQKYNSNDALSLIGG